MQRGCIESCPPLALFESVCGYSLAVRIGDGAVASQFCHGPSGIRWQMDSQVIVHTFEELLIA